MGLRIIGGNLKGKKLLTLSGTSVRPTADRIRESIFNILSDSVKQAVVLDLFAGSGAMGLEALSRGAELAVFIEKQQNAHSIIKHNIKACSLDNKAIPMKWNVQKNLNCLGSFQRRFTLIFIDPPYNRQLIRPSLQALLNADAMDNETRIIIEHSPAESIPEDLMEYRLVDQRKYGKTLVSFLEYIMI